MSSSGLEKHFEVNRHEVEALIDEATPQTLIDSHVHLWPEEMSNEEGHAWMTMGLPLAKQHVLSDYYVAAQQNEASLIDTVVEGVVYVETDVRYEKPDGIMPISVWARGPLDEIRFLRGVVEGNYGERDGRMLLGIVAWAPIDQPTKVLEEWLQLVERVAGEETWSRVKGFRFLLQAIHDQKKFEKLVYSGEFVDNLKLLGRRGFSFDVGVDQRSGGIWQLEAMSKAMVMAHEGVPEHEKVVFVLNHLCKPDFTWNGAHYARWRDAVEVMALQQRTYMKLSGAFSELPGGLGTARSVAIHMKPWIVHVLACFGSHRLMFGSDWPVCGVTRGEESWLAWKDVVKAILIDTDHKMSKEDKEQIWSNTAREAYRI